MKTPEIREAPVPVKAWNEEADSYSENIKRLHEMGWPCDLKYAAEQLDNFGCGGRESRLFVELDSGQIVIVRNRA